MADDTWCLFSTFFLFCLHEPHETLVYDFFRGVDSVCYKLMGIFMFSVPLATSETAMEQMPHVVAIALIKLFRSLNLVYSLPSYICPYSSNP